MAQISFIKGKSVSITIVFNSEYNPANIEDIVVKIGNGIVAQLSLNTILATTNPIVFRVELTSDFTNLLNSFSQMQVSLDDSSLGVYQFELIDIYANDSLGFSNASVNDGSDFTLNLTINPDSTVVDVETVTIYNSFNQEQLDEMSDYADAASSSSTVATTQADIATEQAVIATTKALEAAGSAASIPSFAGIATNFLPKKTAEGFVNSLFGDNGTTATIGGDVVVNGVTVGKGAGNTTNVVLGATNLASNPVGGDNSAIGVASLSNLTSGSVNTAIGRSSGRFIADGTTALTSSEISVFIGALSRPNSNLQINQIAIGYNSIGLGSNTWRMGNSSTTFGRAMGNLLVGSDVNSGEALQVTGNSKLAGNVAVTGSLTTSADAAINGLTVGRGGGNISTNTAIGVSAGQSNTSGSYNSFFGLNAGRLNTTGIFNSFFGREAGGNNINGEYNSFFGVEAGQSNTSGNYNSFFGLNAGKSNTSSSNNSFFGRDAGFSNTTGINNSFFGSTAGRYISGGVTPNTNSTGSTFIGFGASPLGDNQTNQIVLVGNGGTGIGSNTTLIGNSSTATFAVWGDLRLMKGMATAPASATATGIAGEIRVTADFIYVCTGTNQWKRSALDTW